MENTGKDFGFFNLDRDGDSAVVRLLHSSVNTIEAADIHWVKQNDGKRRVVKCLGDGCPICARGVEKLHRVYIHLFDYTDNTEKVWARTDKIIPQFKEIEDSWGALNRCVLKITRAGDNFPKYTVTVQPPTSAPAVSEDMVDKKVAYRGFSTRSKDELEEFLQTGILPAHKKSEYAPKGEYKGGTGNNNTNGNTNTTNSNTAYPKQPTVAQPPADVPFAVDSKPTVENDPFDYDPFAVSIPQKV